MLGREQLLRPEDLPRLPGVLGRHEIGDRAGGAVGRELQHPRAERGQHDPVQRNAGRFELVNIASQSVVGAGILRRRLSMAGADAEHEAARKA